MNILVISHMYPSIFNRMSGIFVHKQIKQLVKKGCNVKVICPIPWTGFPIDKISAKWRKYSQVPKKITIDGIEVYYPRYIEFPNGYFFHKSGERMFRAIKPIVYKLHMENKFDLIHSHVALPDGYCGMLLSKELSLPHVVTVHGQDFQHTINKSEKLKGKVFKVLDDCNEVIVVSNKLKKIVNNTSFIEKVQVINNGVDIAECIVEKNCKYKIPEKIDILSVSNLINTKGIDLNIKAMKELVKTYSDLKYYIVGDGPERINLENLVKEYKLERNIFFTGKLEHEEAMEYMKKCKIFSLPSWKEGFGVVYVEAMLQEKPVIGVKGEGIEDVIDNMKNGILVEPQNLDELVKTMKFLIENNEIAKTLGKEGKKTVIKDFTWDNTADRILKVYNNII
ncbi:glycosyltransferase [Haloimpatiens lingqiaonensis]|uniref:glycosyltransferase n=1 Tax=Haloimpatiens lingqiaonensis TaxID=1380675 RepID=UPI0010FD668B|nr:glycosyltransferase [Haloimpatiens lingqiaonensis]